MPKPRPLLVAAARSRSSSRSLSARGRPRPPTDFLVVGIGASAGGLDACKKLVAALPVDSGMAYILVQHLDPTHESMMVDLLAGHTSMTVVQATDAMPVEPDHLYVIPPGTYLSVGKDTLHLSPPNARHGARLPFDFLLNSLAEHYGARAVCVVMSGTGADGSLGLKAVKEGSGFVIAQDPDEAGFEGMPRNAIMTGAVDLVLPAASIPAALVKHARRKVSDGARTGATRQVKGRPPMAEIIDLLITRAAHDFRSYKLGTLERRTERRMAMAGFDKDDMASYLEVLRNNTSEVELLARDLLINVTSFFRDPKVFDFLAERIIPDLVRNQAQDQPLRIWIAGCSTGEEAYSIAILFKEQFAVANRSAKLQVFASDVDPDAVAIAREGLYPETIAADVSPARLARFFTKEDHEYRVSPDLREVVVFTVQNVLADPPFSRLDFVSCRNLMIYLRTDAQAKVLALFHFALREGGILLLGNSETVANMDGWFEVISKSERLYRHIGRHRPGEVAFLAAADDGARPSTPSRPDKVVSRQASLAELCQRLVLETYAPAAVLVNRKNECLFTLGPTERYLHVAPGHPTHDLLAMARASVRTRLRSAIHQVGQGATGVVVASGRLERDGRTIPVRITVRPVSNDGEDLMLICFSDEPPAQERRPGRLPTQAEASRIAELEQELEATRTELQGAIRSLEASIGDQKVINEEALSVNEEYQSTNEELRTSKEELQSLNEELTALNAQLQEALERQRTTSNDLQNVLYSTDVATIFLDSNLNIRFFTPATRALFNVIPSDVGRPLADLSSLAADSTLLADARIVLQTRAPAEREIAARSGAWYVRRILPYLTTDNKVEGVVITFVDVTDRRHSADLVATARRQAELANVAKSRFLAAASHDLRQPLQTLALLQGLLAKAVEGEGPQRLVARIGETLGAIGSMLNTLLDINQIEAGTIRPQRIDFPISDLFERLRGEFTYQAQAQKLDLRVVPCSLSIHSDQRLLEQMVRNLLSNALKYTRHGKLLLGCRRHSGKVSIEVWDTGIGIPQGELEAVFEEYHQIDNAARDRSRGLGLGLSIVHRLGRLLDHQVKVRSTPGKGSVFAIEVALSSHKNDLPQGAKPHDPDGATAGDAHGACTILIVEDDSEERELLELLLRAEGYRTVTAADGIAALELVSQSTIQPDVLLADYNLPNGMHGLQLAARMREKLGRQLPVIILTGDISTATLRDAALQGCIQLNKPTKLEELTAALQRLYPGPQAVARRPPPFPVRAAATSEPPVIFVVDDDRQIREAIRSVLEDADWKVDDYDSCEAFLESYRPGHEACLLIDAYLPGMQGIELLQRLRKAGHRLPAIMITGNSDVPMAVQAMKAGAADFIEKPIGSSELISSIERALEQWRDGAKRSDSQQAAQTRVALLTKRQREIMERVLAGQPSKNIAADLGISQRTVENHRASIMKRTGSKSLPALARLAVAAVVDDTRELPSATPPPPPTATMRSKTR